MVTNKVIYKYSFPVEDTFELDMPQGAQVLHVEAQYDVPCLWAIVDLTAPIKARKFRLAGTAHPLEDNIGKAHHVGSFFLRGGALVFHLFAL